MPLHQPASPSTPTPILTPRLRLVAITPAMARAAIDDLAELDRLLDAAVPGDWPPVDLADVQGMFAERLAAAPGEVGWWGWYVVALPGNGMPISPDRAVLIGSVGCSKFGSGGCPIFGYGLLPAFWGRGLATEAAVALAGWVMAQPGVERVEATTFERHWASRKILERGGFGLVGVSPDDATAAESDRQGRGQLLLYVRERSAAERA